MYGVDDEQLDKLVSPWYNKEKTEGGRYEKYLQILSCDPVPGSGLCRTRPAGSAALPRA